MLRPYFTRFYEAWERPTPVDHCGTTTVGSPNENLGRIVVDVMLVALNSEQEVVFW